MTEQGNTASMRAALELAVDYSEYLVDHLPDEFDSEIYAASELLEKCDAALSSPPRNCDVGSPEEQTARLRKFCRKYPDDCQGCPCCPNPPVDNCWLVWAQLPYEEAK